MRKLSSEQMQQLLDEAPGVIRGLAQERDFWKEKAASMLRRDQAEKVAHEMQRKGIDADTPFDHLVDRLEKVAEQGKLDEWERSVSMVGTDMGTKLAQLANDEQRVTAGSSELERFIYGSVG